jgi:hypothetical protein
MWTAFRRIITPVKERVGKKSELIMKLEYSSWYQNMRQAPFVLIVELNLIVPLAFRPVGRSGFQRAVPPLFFESFLK